MRVRTGILCGVAITALLLSACGRSQKEPHLMNIRSASRSPDEFAILPTKPLTMPEDLTQLPEPTPGGKNITDPTPVADAVAALGGNPEAVEPGPRVAAASGALLSHAGRFGTSADIRQTLAAEDLDFRRRHNGKLLERLFNATVYYRVYNRFALDQYRELARWRALGIRTDSAPPEGFGK